MPAQGTVSSTPAPRHSGRIILWFLLFVTVGVAVAVIAATGFEMTRARVLMLAASPTGAAMALVRERRCAEGFCHELRLGASESDAVAIERLGKQSCTEIAWTADGSRVGFVIDGSEVWIYDAAKRTLAGRVKLLTLEAAQSRLARGVTFSENGRALTFDDCPRKHSGCRSGVVGVPQ